MAVASVAVLTTRLAEPGSRFVMLTTLPIMSPVMCSTLFFKFSWSEGPLIRDCFSTPRAESSFNRFLYEPQFWLQILRSGIDLHTVKHDCLLRALLFCRSHWVSAQSVFGWVPPHEIRCLRSQEKTAVGASQLFSHAFHATCVAFEFLLPLEQVGWRRTTTICFQRASIENCFWPLATYLRTMASYGSRLAQPIFKILRGAPMLTRFYCFVGAQL